MARQQPPDDDWEDIEAGDWEDIPSGDWEDITPVPPVQTQSEINVTQPVAPPPGIISKTWSALSDPLTTKPREWADQIANYIDNPQGEGGYLRGFAAGGLQGLGDVISGLTSPIDMAATVTGLGGLAAARRGFKGVSRVAKGIEKASGYGAMAHGAGTILDPNASWGEKGTGLMEIAGGRLASKGKLGEIGATVKGRVTGKPVLPGSAGGVGGIDLESALHAKPKPGAPPAAAVNQTGKFSPLPTDLQGAKPRFNIGQNSFEPRFESDVDKALYIIAQDTPSKRNDDYMKYIIEQTGLSADEAIALGKQIKDRVKFMVRGQPAGAVDIPMIHTPKPPTGGGSIGSIRIKNPTPEILKKALEQGWKVDTLNPDGSIKLIRGEAPAAGSLPILESEVGLHKPTAAGAKQPLSPKAQKAVDITTEILNYPRAMMASVDMSAPLRQGLPLWHKWKLSHFVDMVKAWGSEDFYNAAQKEIAERPLFRERVGIGGTIMDSFADEAGLQLSDLKGLKRREENLMSTWAGKTPILGRAVNRSNRAYTLFLNKLRADTFEDLVKSGKVFGADANADLTLARGLADFVNYASGRGSLGKAEGAAQILNTGFFSPRLMASRIKILNPWTYVNPNTPSQVRKESIKSLVALAAAGNTVVQLGKMAGAEVENDPASSDFGKLKIGNVRLDPWAGAQQYVVAVNRLLRPRGLSTGDEGWEGMQDTLQPSDTGIVPLDLASGLLASPGGKFKNSATGAEYFLGEKFGGSDKVDITSRFLEGKANPIINFVTGLGRGKDITGQPFNVPEEIVQRMVPIFLQDLKELATEDPNLIPFIHENPSYLKDEYHTENLPWAVPSFFGMATQKYLDRDE